MSGQTEFYNSLGASLDRAWSLVSDGADDRNAPAHTPILATLDATGAPKQRVMVLRSVDRDARTLRFHSDSRSSKIDEIQASPAVSVLVYDAEEKIQLRLRGNACAAQDGPWADTAWRNADNFARRCYLSDPAPSTPSDKPVSGLPDRLEGRKPSDQELVSARPNFAVILMEIHEIDFLYLAHQGHRRARFAWQSGRWAGQWLVP